MKKIDSKFWDSVAGKTLISSLHDSYWDALSCLTSIEEALREAGNGADAQTAAELTKAVQMVKAAHDKVATLNDKLCPGKVF